MLFHRNQNIESPRFRSMTCSVLFSGGGLWVLCCDLYYSNNATCIILYDVFVPLEIGFVFVTVTKLLDMNSYVKMMTVVINSLKTSASSSCASTSDRSEERRRSSRRTDGGGGKETRLLSFCYQIDHYKLYLTCSVVWKTNGAVSQLSSPITPCPFCSINSCFTRTDLGGR